MIRLPDLRAAGMSMQEFSRAIDQLVAVLRSAMYTVPAPKWPRLKLPPREKLKEWGPYR